MGRQAGGRNGTGNKVQICLIDNYEAKMSSIVEYAFIVTMSILIEDETNNELVVMPLQSDA